MSLFKQHQQKIIFPGLKHGALLFLLFVSFHLYAQSYSSRAIDPVAAFIVSDSLICAGNCIQFTDLSSGNPTNWTWQFPGASPSTFVGQNTGLVCYATSGVYAVTLIVTNATGADTLTKSAYIQVDPNPIVNAGNDSTIALGNSIGLSATGTTGTYTWSPGSGLSCTSCASTIAAPEVTTTYTLTLTTNNGCISSDTVIITVLEAYSIFVPSGFSPNGDGANDILFVRGAGIRSIEFYVFNRLGEKVFEGTDLRMGWDGTFRDKPLNPDVFVYYVKANYYDGRSETIKGDVTLIR